MKVTLHYPRWEAVKHLGVAIVVAECEQGFYDPLGTTYSFSEAKELAAEDFRGCVFKLRIR
jgi:hypothetical protein